MTNLAIYSGPGPYSEAEMRAAMAERPSVLALASTTWLKVSTFPSWDSTKAVAAPTTPSNAANTMPPACTKRVVLIPKSRQFQRSSGARYNGKNQATRLDKRAPTRRHASIPSRSKAQTDLYVLVALHAGSVQSQLPLP